MEVGKLIERLARLDEAEVVDTTPLQQKVIDIETNIGGLGSAAARKEKEVKQQLQDLWESKGIGVKH